MRLCPQTRKIRLRHLNDASADRLERLRQALLTRAQEEGFVAAGIAGAGEDPRRIARLKGWLDEGRHGSMGWMEDRADQLKEDLNRGNTAPPTTEFLAGQVIEGDSTTLKEK